MIQLFFIDFAMMTLLRRTLHPCHLVLVGKHSNEGYMISYKHICPICKIFWHFWNGPWFTRIL